MKIYILKVNNTYLSHSFLIEETSYFHFSNKIITKKCSYQDLGENDHARIIIYPGQMVISDMIKKIISDVLPMNLFYLKLLMHF